MFTQVDESGEPFNTSLRFMETLTFFRKFPSHMFRDLILFRLGHDREI